jgi:hypothetical protein
VVKRARILPKEWPSVFAQCQATLSPNGSLIIIEDQQPSIGELPHRHGFIVLDHIEAQALFGGTDTVHDLSSAVPEPFRGRVSVLQVPANHLSRATHETVRTALGHVQRRARAKIASLRESKAGELTQREGRLHALYAMLWVNAELALA